jgi:hypothetical protein
LIKTKHSIGHLPYRDASGIGPFKRPGSQYNGADACRFKMKSAEAKVYMQPRPILLCKSNEICLNKSRRKKGSENYEHR